MIYDNIKNNLNRDDKGMKIMNDTFTQTIDYFKSKGGRYFVTDKQSVIDYLSNRDIKEIKEDIDLFMTDSECKAKGSSYWTKGKHLDIPVLSLQDLAALENRYIVSPQEEANFQAKCNATPYGDALDKIIFEELDKYPMN